MKCVPFRVVKIAYSFYYLLNNKVTKHEIKTFLSATERSGIPITVLSSSLMGGTPSTPNCPYVKGIVHFLFDP